MFSPVLWMKKQARSFSYRPSSCSWRLTQLGLLTPASILCLHPANHFSLCSGPSLGPSSAEQGSLSHGVPSGCRLPPQLRWPADLLLQHTDPSHRPLPSTGADSCEYLVTLMHRPNAKRKVVFFQVCCFPSESWTPEAI